MRLAQFPLIPTIAEVSVYVFFARIVLRAKFGVCSKRSILDSILTYMEIGTYVTFYFIQMLQIAPKFVSWVLDNFAYHFAQFDKNY